MVEADDATADVAARGVVVGRDEGPDAGVGAEDPRRRERGGEFGAICQQEVNLFRGNFHVVALLVGHSC